MFLFFFFFAPRHPTCFARQTYTRARVSIQAAAAPDNIQHSHRTYRQGPKKWDKKKKTKHAVHFFFLAYAHAAKRAKRCIPWWTWTLALQPSMCGTPCISTPPKYLYM